MKQICFIIRTLDYILSNEKLSYLHENLKLDCIRFFCIPHVQAYKG